jgi:carboxyl-terminal processing protease
MAMRMNKINPSFFTGMLVAFGIALSIKLYIPIERFFENGKDQKINTLLQFIEQDYVDKVDTEKILEDVVSEIVAKLDPHSVYFSKEDFLASQENMQGNFEGIGVQFFMYNDSIAVTKVLKGGPSEKAGILSGDRILIANNDTLYSKKLSSRNVVKALKGPADTKVDLRIYRKQTNAFLDIPIVRNKVPISSLEVGYMLTKDMGYLKLNRFAMTSYQEFKEKLSELQTQGAKKLVLDVRQNGGGYIHIANQIIDEFLEADKLIVFTENNKGNIEKSYATSKGSFEDGKVYVLIDEGSASASEILAGALQDNDKGVIVGRRSFGKGLVQQQKNFGDGSAVRLTIARYFTPTGRCIQKPYRLDDNSNYALDYEMRMTNGELLSKDSIKVVDSLRYTTPKGKVVYGGGGIVPDVFVPVDTTLYLENYHFKNLNDFVFEYVDNNRSELSALSLETLQEKMDVNTEMIKNYFDFIQLKKALPKEKTKKIKHYLKMLVVAQLFDQNSTAKMNARKDEMILKVLELEKEKH